MFGLETLAVLVSALNNVTRIKSQSSLSNLQF